MDHAEAVAKCLLEEILPGSRMEYHPCQSHGEHDFDLYHPDGRVSVVEATSLFDKTLQGTWFEILNKKKGGPTIKTRLCKKSWHISVSPNARIDQVRKYVDEGLAAVERAGITKFHAPTDCDSNVQALYASLKVVSGSALPDWTKPACILLGLPGPSGTVIASAAIGAAEREAFKRDNRRKLGARMEGERHLTVYSPANSLAAFALMDLEPPPNRANLPPEISNIWIFTEGVTAREYVVWRSVIHWWSTHRASTARLGLTSWGTPPPRPFM